MAKGDMHLRMEARYAMPNGLPTTFVIDRDGTVRHLHLGYDATIVDQIQALLNSSLPPPPHGDRSP